MQGSDNADDMNGILGSLDQAAWLKHGMIPRNFPYLVGARNKLSECVKNIVNNFDSAVGLKEKSNAPGSSSDGTSIFICLWISSLRLVV